MKKKIDDLDSGIRKLMDSIYGSDIEERVEAKFNELRSGLEPKASSMADIAPVIAGIRETKDRLARLESEMNRTENLMRKSEGIDKEKLRSTLQAEIDMLSSELKEQAAKDRDKIEDMQSQMSGLKDIFRELREIHEAMKGFDAKAMEREIESLKQKVSWLEQNQSPEGIDDLRERLDEIEAQFRGVKSGSPLVIE